MIRQLFIFLASAAAVPAIAQMTVSTAMTPTQLVEDVLLGGGVTVSNVTYTGVNVSRGSFTTGTSNNLGLNAGVTLSCGDVMTVPGNGGGTVDPSGGGGSDMDLAALSGQGINNAAILEFDFVPTGDSLHFKYVFASEEYPIWVCSNYNDAFGFFLSGPGINGPFSNNSINIAVVPNTAVPITINTINSGMVGSNGTASTCAAADPNWQNNSIYYVDNASGSTVAFNGFTTVLTAYASVQCGETYHIKLAIGNGSPGGFDEALPSGVFLEAGSFQSNVLPVLTASTLFGDGTAAEGCQGGNFTIFRPPGVDGIYSIDFFMTGTATPGVDYTELQSPAVIPAGEDSVVIAFEAFEDGIDEGIETAIMNVFLINTCGDTATSSVILAILDNPGMELSGTTPLLLQCDQDSIAIFATVSGGFGNVTMFWGDSIYSDHIYVSGLQSGSYTVSATDQCPKTITMEIEVDAGCAVIIPNVITPNGDGHNDRFVIEGILGRENHVQIWDRWGKEVLNTRNYQNNFGGQGLNDGLYFYVIRVLDKDYTGNLQVLGAK